MPFPHERLTKISSRITHLIIGDLNENHDVGDLRYRVELSPPVRMYLHGPTTLSASVIVGPLELLSLGFNRDVDAHITLKYNLALGQDDVSIILCKNDGPVKGYTVVSYGMSLDLEYDLPDLE